MSYLGRIELELKEDLLLFCVLYFVGFNKTNVFMEQVRSLMITLAGDKMVRMIGTLPPVKSVKPSRES